MPLGSINDVIGHMVPLEEVHGDISHVVPLGKVRRADGQQLCREDSSRAVKTVEQ